jgi:hypothetical protein
MLHLPVDDSGRESGGDNPSFRSKNETWVMAWQGPLFSLAGGYDARDVKG